VNTHIVLGGGPKPPKRGAERVLENVARCGATTFQDCRKLDVFCAYRRQNYPHAVTRGGARSRDLFLTYAVRISGTARAGLSGACSVRDAFDTTSAKSLRLLVTGSNERNGGRRQGVVVR